LQHIKTATGLDAHCPVKWNFKDLDRALAAHDLLHQKEILLSKSDAHTADLAGLLGYEFELSASR